MQDKDIENKNNNSNNNWIFKEINIKEIDVNTSYCSNNNINNLSINLTRDRDIISNVSIELTPKEMKQLLRIKIKSHKLLQKLVNI
jgi:hypothetical protein